MLVNGGMLVTETQTVDLAAWLTRIWDEEERLAKAAPGRNWQAFVMDDVAGASVYDEQWVLLYPQHYDHDNPLSREPGATGPMYIERAVDELCAHVARHDPASVLARIAAHKEMLAECCISLENKRPGYDGTQRFAWQILRLLASAHRDRPGWQEAWQ